jgi:CDP-diacylglycerol--serine O-phosphatidyltransferase
VADFEGMPIPSRIALTGLLALAAHGDPIGPALWGGAWSLGPWRWHPLSLPFALRGVLMVSKTLRIPQP